jgi:hypothetical protein
MHWMSIALDPKVTAQLGLATGGRVSDPWSITQDFDGGSVILDFATDSCRVVAGNEVLACTSGLGAPMLERLLGRQSKGESNTLKLAKVFDLQSLGLNPSDIEVRLLDDSREFMLFSHFALAWQAPNVPRLIECFERPQAQGWVRSRPLASGRLTTWVSRSRGSETEALSVEMLEGQTNKTTTRQTLDLQVREGSLKDASPGRQGLYVWTAQGHRHISATGTQATSVDAAQAHYRLISERDALLWSGKGAGCAIEHLVANREFPQSFLPSGLKTPCVSEIRVARSPQGVVATWWDRKKERWNIGVSP